MSGHTKLSPSKRSRWGVCPGSIREEAKYPDTDSGPAAVDGTHTHTLVEKCIKAGLADPMTFVRTSITDHDGTFVVDTDRAARAKIAIDYVKSRVAEYGPSAMVMSESRVDPAYLLGRDDMGGTVDIQIRGGDTLEIIDYKDGMGVVDVVGNKQLEQYAMGVLAGYRFPVNAVYPFKWIRMTIIQPKLIVKNMPVTTSYELTVDQMLAKIPQMVIEASRTDDPEAPLVPGDSQCKFCKAKGSCTALAGYVTKEVGMMFQPTQVTEIAHQAANKDPNTMTDQQIREIMEAAPLMRQLLEAVDAEALRRFNAGVSIPGLKAVYGRGSRNWALPEDQIAEKLIKMGVPKSSVYETKLVSPAKAEKLTWEKTKAGEKVKVQLTERQLKTMETEYVVKIGGKLTIVPDSDPRQAVVLNAAPMFSAVEAPVDSLPDWLK